MNLKKNIGKVLTSKSVGTGPSSYEKRIYRATVSQRLRNTAISETLTTPLYCIFIIIVVNHCPFIEQGLNVVTRCRFSQHW